MIFLRGAEPLTTDDFTFSVQLKDIVVSVVVGVVVDAVCKITLVRRLRCESFLDPTNLGLNLAERNCIVVELVLSWYAATQSSFNLISRCEIQWVSGSVNYFSIYAIRY